MTNFEQWKQNLTIKGLEHIISQSCQLRNVCPAHLDCIEANKNDIVLCINVLKKWANAPAEQEVKP